MKFIEAPNIFGWDFFAVPIRLFLYFLIDCSIFSYFRMFTSQNYLLFKFQSFHYNLMDIQKKNFIINFNFFMQNHKVTKYYWFETDYHIKISSWVLLLKHIFTSEFTTRTNQSISDFFFLFQRLLLKDACLGARSYWIFHCFIYVFYL